VIFGHANPVLIASVAAVACGVHLFVVFYEEPTLRKKFGEDYKEYCRNVSRWLPRLRAGMAIAKQMHYIAEGFLMKLPAIYCVVLVLALVMIPAVAQVTTSQYDNSRTGATLNETILTPQNMNATDSASWARSKWMAQFTPSRCSFPP